MRLQHDFCYIAIHFVSNGIVPRPGAGYFALSGKVTKTLPKPRRFRTSRFVRRVMRRVSAGRLYQIGRNFAV